MRWRRDQGSTLFEVIVAFGILTLTLSTVLPAFSELSTTTYSAKTRWAAAEFARSRLDELGVIDPVREGVSTGVESDLWSWRLVMMPHQIAETAIGSGPQEATISVTPIGSRDPVVSLTTIVAAERDEP